MTHDESEMMDDIKILTELDESIKTRFDDSIISMIVSNGDTTFLSIWKRPSRDSNNKESRSSMKYLPLFYVICSIDEKNTLVLKLITHHGKVVDTLSDKNPVEEDINSAFVANEDYYQFIKKLENLRLCRGIENLSVTVLPHLAEQFEETIIIRSRECTFALSGDELSCQACQNLSKYKNVRLQSKHAQRPKNKGQTGIWKADLNLYQNFSSDHDMDISSAAVTNKFEEHPFENVSKIGYEVDSDLVDFPDDISLHDVNFEMNQEHDRPSLKRTHVSRLKDASLKKIGDNSKDKSSSLVQRRKFSYNCDKCSKAYSSKAQLNRHKNQIHKPSDIHSEETNLGIQTEKNKNDSLFSSQECDLRNSEESQKDVHHPCDIPGKQKLFTCGKCDKEFTSKIEVSKHRKEEHLVQSSDTVIKGYKCPNCDFTTSRKTGLTDHINAVHDKVKPYMCQHCSHTFASNGNLTQHIHAVHEKLRPFICQYCSYATSSQPNLRKHIKAVHHKIRDFKCELCSFDAASKQLLDRHVKAVHEKIKAYKCKFCQYECAKGYNMKVHIRHVHEKLKGYKCDQCSFEATRKGKLTEHQSACHGQVVAVTGAQENTSNQIISNIAPTPSSAETIIVQSPIETRSVLVDS